MEKKSSLANINLNEAFGFATIIAAINSISETFAVPFTEIKLVPAFFLFYFLVFRIKMYLDDANHEFSGDKKLDMFIAIASWLGFLISAAAVEKDICIAVNWFCIALGISFIWILYAYCRSREPKFRYVLFGFFNLLHIAVLVTLFHLSDPNTPTIVAGFIFLVCSVWLDAFLTRRLGDKKIDRCNLF